MNGKRYEKGGSGVTHGFSLLACFLYSLPTGGTIPLAPDGAQEFKGEGKERGLQLLRWSSLVFSLALAVTLCSTVGFSEAVSYYVASDGDNRNTCAEAQNPTTAMLTIARGIGCLSSGDTLIIKGGTYNEGLYNPPSGNSSDQVTTLKGAPGETVIIKPDKADYVIGIEVPRAYISIENLTVDGNNKSSGFGVWLTASHTRFKDLEFQQVAGDVFGVSKEDNNPVEYGSNEFTNIRIHDSGEACNGAYPEECVATHGFYVSTSNNLFDGVVVDGVPGHGIQIYDTDSSRKVGNVIRNSTFHNNGVGVGIFAADDTIVENNLFENNILDIWVGGGSTNTIIRDNTVQGISDSGIYVEPSSTGTQIID